MALDLPLRSCRLLLRPFEEADAPAAHAVYGDAEVMRYVGEGRPATPEQTAEMIADYRRGQREHGFAFWAVIERSSGRLIGDAGLEPTRFGTELGYTLGRASWGRGFATEAAGLCVEAAFGPLELARLVALADVANPASAHVLTKLGFTRAGEVTAYGRPHGRFVLERPPR
jgi:[ribosomal protein S5]-alanine N-acetyltransferase